MARVDAGVRQGDEITPFYDPMIAKLIVHGSSRQSALDSLSSTLEACQAIGVTTNIPFLAALAGHADFASGNVDTGLIDRDLERLVARPDAPLEAFALAALEALGLVRPDHLGRSSDSDPWSSLTGWRLWSEAEHVASLACGEDQIDVRVTIESDGSYRIDAPGGSVVIEELTIDGDTIACRTADRTFPARVVRHDATITVSLDGHIFCWTIPDPLAGSAGPDATQDRLIAPMPGLIKVVAAARGDQVARDAPLIVMEAMKMEHTLRAPRDGIVGETFVQVGDQVEEGGTLLELVGPSDEAA